MRIPGLPVAAGTTAGAAADPARVPTDDTLALIGLREGADPAHFARIRFTQLVAGRDMALFLLAANLVCGAVTIMVFGDAVSLPHLVGWGGSLVAIAVGVALRRLSGHRGDTGQASLAELRDTALEGVALGAVWSVPITYFAVPGTPEAFAMWVIASVLMVAAALALAPLALATMLFLSIVGTAGAAKAALSGDAAAAGATALLTLMLMAACVIRARMLVALRSAQLSLAERDETISLLLHEHEQSASDWLWETDANRRIVRASQRFAHALGLEPAAFEALPLVQVLAGGAWQSGDFAPGLRMLAEKVKAREPFRDLAIPVTVKGEVRWWEMGASPRYDEGGTFIGFRGVGSDVTAARASVEKIARMARFDPLTSLPNRLSIHETLGRALDEAMKWRTRAAVMLIDLDRFKAVNDTLGHQIGDRLLCRVAARLAALAEGSAVIGRLGGDEFGVVIPDASDAAKVDGLATRIIETLSRPYEVEGHTIYIGASIGIATGPRDGNSTELLLRSADLALYRSKDAGGGVHHAYEVQLHEVAEERRLLETALRQALERGELHLDYQPVVDGRTERLVGFEALLRWTNPRLGAVSPAKFIPIAEEARLIGPIGEWVVRTACREAASWPGDVRVAVNVSPEQLCSSSFAAVVATALAESGLVPDRLELEVTESVFMKDSGATRVLESILELGVHLSLDDFGTGYSSLGYLSRTRFSTIKIDRSFVRNAARGVPEALAIIRAVVALARSLGMATTAEGVETEDELAMIRDLGCSKVQGYYYGRPLPVVEARGVVQRHCGAARAA